MKNVKEFKRAIAMMAAISSAMSLQAGFLRDSALAAIGPYVSRGKGGKNAHRKSGAAQIKRASMKRKNRRAAK